MMVLKTIDVVLEYHYILNLFPSHLRSRISRYNVNYIKLPDNKVCN